MDAGRPALAGVSGANEFKVADARGVVAWDWAIGSNTTRGLGSVEVTCAGVLIREGILIG